MPFKYFLLMDLNNVSNFSTPFFYVEYTDYTDAYIEM